MDDALVDVFLVRDLATVTAICAEVGNDAEEAWVLCGVCIRKLPFEGAVV